jgi:hypothetical protein
VTAIAEPGVYDIPAEDYHADPIPGGSLSSSGARKLLPPSCPALFKYEQDNPQPHRKTFDFGHAAHGEVLGTGPELVVVDAKDWKTKAAQEKRDEAHARGAVPLLPADYERVQAMAAALRRHPMAHRLLNPGRGRAEQTLIWRDEPTGVWRRALVDWLPELGTGRPLFVDYKTTQSAEPKAIGKTVHNYGYGHQGAWYLDGAIALGYPAETAFVFIFQEKTPPYLITIAQVDETALNIARARNRQAIEIYRDCRETGVWPGYADDVVHITLPAWAERRELEEIA